MLAYTLGKFWVY